MSRFKEEQEIAKQAAVSKAKVHGECTWPFQVGKQNFAVTAVKTGSKVRTETKPFKIAKDK